MSTLSAIHVTKETRDKCLLLAAKIGEVASHVTAFFPSDANEQDLEPNDVPVLLQTTMDDVWFLLLDTASAFNLNLAECTMRKVELNRIKYPTLLCQVRRLC